jgi:hypothetical protein
VSLPLTDGGTDGKRGLNSTLPRQGEKKYFAFFGGVPMGRRSRVAWQELFEAQARSGMSVREFCRKRGVCARSFVRRKRELVEEEQAASPFVRVEAAAVPRAVPQERRVRLKLGRCEWELGGLGLDDLAHLMKALA